MHFLDPDSPLMRGLSRMTDLVFLNLITLAACLPVITAGASLTAMHFVLLKMVRGEEGYIFRDWRRAFKRDLGRSTCLWLLFLLAGLAALYDLRITAGGGTFLSPVLRGLLIPVILVVWADFLWAFPLLSRFEAKVPEILTGAAALAFKNLPRTLAMGIFSALPLIIWILFPSMAPLVVLFGASLPGSVSAYMYSPVFEKLEKGRGGEEDPAP